MKGMIKQNTVITLVIIMAAAGTLVAIFTLAPESVHLRSADGCFYLQGKIGQASEVTASQRLDLDKAFSVLPGPIYEINFGSDFLPSPFTLTLCAQPQWGPINELSIYAYDDKLAVWRPMQSVPDPGNSTLTAEIRTPFSLWGVGRRLAFETPNEHEAMMEELLAWPPESAVGYRVYASFALEDGDFVLVDDLVERGGCSGVYFSGVKQSGISVEKEAVGGIYRLNAIWELGEGCMEGEEIRAD